MKFDTYIEEFIDLAIREDIGDGDHTSLATIPSNIKGKAHLLVKQEGILCGSNIAFRIFMKLDPNCEFKQLIKDGTHIKKGDIPFTVHGNVIALLQAERLILNIIQRLSGIATTTNLYVEKLAGLKTKILDTRKTTPGMRYLEKIAVKTGGGVNHRMGLFDMIMIKDNHIDFAGGIEQAIGRTQEYLKAHNKSLKIIIEARSIEDVHTILNFGGINRIMLDNFSIEKTKEAVDIINGRVETESSGGITLETIRDFAECGVDYISVGALTHQIKSLDLSLKAIDY
jgi:nicotinate-nucleotide pyrophosphorylase (carboxylating)